MEIFHGQKIVRILKEDTQFVSCDLLPQEKRSSCLTIAAVLSFQNGDSVFRQLLPVSLAGSKLEGFFYALLSPEF